MTSSPPMLTAAEAGRAAALALDHQSEAEWVDRVAAAAAHARDDAVLWQWTALLHRALDDRCNAIVAYRNAVAAAPGDARILHGLARTRWEAGLPSLDDYARARAAAPFDGDILLGLAAAEVAAGEGRRALAGLQAILAQEPRWIDGQRQAAHLRYVLGDGDAYTADIERGLTMHPRDEALWHLLLTLHRQRGASGRVATVVRRAHAALGERPFITLAAAVHASDAGDVAAADADFARLERLGDASIAVHHVRHLVRTGRWARAAALIQPWLAGPASDDFYPYAGLVWRVTGDRRQAWLDRDGALVRTFDLGAALPPLDDLAATLRTLHRLRGDPLDQSVRGGSQTDGPLLANLDPAIQATRTAIVVAVEAYIAALPARDARHPALRHRRDARPRFAGSWSVRLRGAGRHTNHIHPLGWISSALYVGVPEHRAGHPPDAGWLTIGEPPSDLGLDLPPYRTVRPAPGTLVLFPSTCWHGTRPVADGERLTIAFDIAPPHPR